MGKPRPNEQSKENHQSVYELMRQIGAPSYTPLPPDHHEWQRSEGEPPLYRMWSWMVHSTVFWGRRRPYAVNTQGQELHIEHMAKDLGMDLANTYHYWRIGVKRGLWRNGAEAEGTRRLYLSGKVPKQRRSAEDEIVCTYNFPASIYKQIKEWPEERIQTLRDSLEEVAELEKAVTAAVIAAKRELFIQRQNTILEAHGVKPVVQKHKKQDESEEDAERRRQRTAPILAPLELYVHTIEEYVQSCPEPAVQTSGTDASLLCSEKIQKSGMTVGRTMPDSRRSKAHSEGEKPTKKQHPAPKPQQYAVPKTEPLTQAEKEAETQLFDGIRSLQQAFPHLDFSKELISTKCRNDHLIVWRILSLVGPENVQGFLNRVGHQLKNLDRNAFGKLPGQAPRPRSLGLILYWAGQYSEALDEAARITAEEEAYWRARNIAACIEIINDPAETADAKFEARKWLQEHQADEAQVA